MLHFLVGQQRLPCPTPPPLGDRVSESWDVTSGNYLASIRKQVTPADGESAVVSVEAETDLMTKRGKQHLNAATERTMGRRRRRRNTIKYKETQTAADPRIPAKAVRYNY